MWAAVLLSVLCPLPALRVLPTLPVLPTLFLSPAEGVERERDTRWLEERGEGGKR